MGGEHLKRNVVKKDTTRFSGVESQLRPTMSVDETIDTTRFSGVEFQFSPTTSVDETIGWHLYKLVE